MTSTLNYNAQAQNHKFVAIEDRFMHIKYIYVYKRNLNPKVK